MIVCERKPFDEIRTKLGGCKKLLILGCGTCVSVCMAGGEREVEILATQLRMYAKKNGGDNEIGQATIQRQCDPEYIEPIIDMAKGYDELLSMACGAGVQMVANLLEPLPVLPAGNTRFIGVTEDEGNWAEQCRACGNCLLADFGGICPMTMCAKSLVNGPCGGSQQGKCEVDKSQDCAWARIIARLTKQGRLDTWGERPPLLKDYSRQQHPAHLVHEAYRTPGDEAHSK